jgi:hypothetical protein
MTTTLNLYPAHAAAPAVGDYLVADAFGRIIGRAWDVVDGVDVEHLLSGAHAHVARLDAADAWLRLTDLAVNNPLTLL